MDDLTDWHHLREKRTPSELQKAGKGSLKTLGSMNVHYVMAYCWLSDDDPARSKHKPKGTEHCLIHFAAH
jgi:hypothetical protein